MPGQLMPNIGHRSIDRSEGCRKLRKPRQRVGRADTRALFGGIGLFLRKIIDLLSF